jgi:hypothetical protein
MNICVLTASKEEVIYTQDNVDMYVKYAMSMWTIGFIWLKMWISGELL